MLTMMVKRLHKQKDVVTDFYLEDPYFIHHRSMDKILKTLSKGGVMVYPTDSGYALGVSLDQKKAIARLRQLRGLDLHHDLTLVCENLSEIAQYAHVDNPTYRLIKRLTPGHFTFILPASKAVPKLMGQPSKKTIGIRVPNLGALQSLVAESPYPLVSTSLTSEDPLLACEVKSLDQTLIDRVDLVLDIGFCDNIPTTVVDCTASRIQIIRVGRPEDVALIEGHA